MSELKPSQLQGTSFRFRLHGPFTVARDGAPLAAPDIGSRKGRTLLKLLLLERGHVVRNDRIAEVLWGELPPDNAHRLIATLVSRLRSVLGPDAVEGVGGGYRFEPSSRLEVDVDEGDRLVVEAEARLAAAEPSLAQAAAEQAIGVFAAGAVLEDEPYAEWAEGARAHADRMMRRARRTAWLAALGLEDTKQALVHAEAAVEADPFDEEAHRAVMLAHRDEGRPAEALAAYERLRTQLADELGTDPAPETRTLHLAILQEAPAAASARTAAEPVATAPAEPSDPAFVGREEEIALLAGLWRDAARGHPRLVLVAGEAGIGKTRLASEIVDVAESTGGTVALSRCYEAERSLFLQPITDAIRSIIVRAKPDLLREIVGSWAGTLAELVPEIGTILRPHHYDRATPEIERRRSFEAVTAFIRSLAERRPVLLFLDDLHQAGSSTLELLHFLVRRASRARLLVLATIRVEESEEVVAHLSDVGGRLDVGPLPEAAVTELARRMGGGHLADRIVEMTRGHALFAVEMLRAMAERTTDMEEGAVPQSLRTAVMERVQRTGPDVEEMLRMGAVLGSAFELPAVAGMLDVGVEEAARRADRARAARLLQEAGSSFEFANDLVREILYRTTPQPVLIARHQRAAHLLADNPEAVGAHARAAGDWATAHEAWLQAADRAAARYANRDAELLLDRAIDAAQHVDDPVGETEALLARGRAREGLADYRGAHEDHAAALGLARSAGDRSVEMQALRDLGGDVLVGLGRPSRESLPYLEAALPIAEELDDVATQVDVLSRMAVVWTNRLRFDVATEHARRAVDLARGTGDDRSIALALDGMKSVSAYSGDLAALEPLLPELERRLRKLGHLWHLHWTLFESSFPAMARAEWDRALARIGEALDLTRKTGYRAYQPMFVAHRGWIERSRGQYGAALEAGRQAVALADDVGHPWWIAFARTMLGWSLTEVGAIEEALDQLGRGLEAAERESSESYVLRCVAHLALAAQESGDRRVAGELLDRAEALIDGITTPPGEAFLHGAHSYLAASRAALARDEPDRAERLLAPVLEAAGPSGWRETAAEAASLAGRARLALDDTEGAEASLRRSLEEAERSEIPRMAWEAHASLGQVLTRRDATEEAEGHLSAAKRLVRSLAGSIDDDAYRKSFLAAARRRLRAVRP